MYLSLEWLKDFVDLDASSRLIAENITNTGSHVESIIVPSEGIDGVVVGKILSIEPHPDADRLVVCQVDVGERQIQIVTGAPNVFEGALVPVSLVGAHLAGGLKIKKSKLRGVVSEGMFCSYQELGVSESVIPKEYRDGVLIFKEDIAPGTDVLEVLGLRDDVLELEITPNRPDCLSVMGMAYEAAASFQTPIHWDEIALKEEGDVLESLFAGVELDTEHCRGFYARVLQDVKIEESPRWLQNRLIASGVRPINTIVDLTNYVMLLTGQPLHAYDLDRLRQKKIVVRQGEDGELFTTLDGEERKLTGEDIVICDGEGPVGLGGMMGGLDSEITEATTNVLLEGANFDAEIIRRSSRRLALRTEASSRFEKGISLDRTRLAVDEAAALAEKLGCGTVAKGSLYVGEELEEPWTVSLRPDRGRKLIGEDISTEEMVRILESLGLTVEFKDIIVATIPPHRRDLRIEEDLIEEVARIYGFHKITPKPLSGNLTRGGKPLYRRLEKKMKGVLRGLGFDEFMTYSFISPKAFDSLALPEDSPLRDCVVVENPLGEEYSVMRTTLLSNMMETLSKNARRGNPTASGYEFGNTFTTKRNDEGLPGEEMKLALGFYGAHDVYFMKEAIRLALESIGLDQMRVETVTDVPYLHPGRSANIYAKDVLLGVFGEVHPTVLSRYGMKERAVVCELNMNTITALPKGKRLYRALPKFPGMSRDFSFLFKEDVEMGEVKAIVEKTAKDLLEEFYVFDIYRGEGIGANMKSVAFRVGLRAGDHTLTEEEVSPIFEAVVREMEEKLQGTLRS